jgi:hypothetical protein
VTIIGHHYTRAHPTPTLHGSGATRHATLRATSAQNFRRRASWTLKTGGTLGWISVLDTRALALLHETPPCVAGGSATALFSISPGGGESFGPFALPNRFTNVSYKCPPSSCNRSIPTILLTAQDPGDGTLARCRPRILSNVNVPVVPSTQLL